jgi:hypothetical protein
MLPLPQPGLPGHDEPNGQPGDQQVIDPHAEVLVLPAA